ncbi:MAG: TetR/AcrR family transcriptional regulator [Prevotellaceae bacterium]|jgi:AcrR family transcriptional regulator|nr:TetR/AcrR family transcriptional regulator [Prevotellaceae bacterium]
MINNNINTEQRILEAAKQVFMQKGMKVATTQEIADIAGVNKALLHYYFRNKEKLHLAVFQDIIKTYLPNLVGIMIARQPLEQRIRAFVSAYIDVLSANSYLAQFLVHEIQQNTERFMQQFMHLAPERLIRIVNHSLYKENIRHITAVDLMVNMLSLCVFPFIVKPMLNHIIFKDEELMSERFFLQRKQTVSDFIINSLYYENHKTIRHTC